MTKAISFFLRLPYAVLMALFFVLIGGTGVVYADTDTTNNDTNDVADGEKNRDRGDFFGVTHALKGDLRVRAYDQDNFTHNSDNNFIQDNRLRLYYTAKLHDLLKFGSKIELKHAWGDEDDTSLRVKNAYADFTVGSFNTKAGLVNHKVGHGLLFDDDFLGILIHPQYRKNNKKGATLGYMCGNRGPLNDGEKHTGNSDGMFLLSSTLQKSAVTVVPYMLYRNADDALLISATNTNEMASVTGNVSTFWLGTDVDIDFGASSAWASFIYNGGEYGESDINGLLLAAGTKAGVAHGSLLYASGDDNDSDDTIDAFIPPMGSSFYWSEILGYGTFDNTSPLDGRSAGYGDSTLNGDTISNLVAINAGITLRPLHKVTLSLDAWYATLPKEENGNDYIGMEFNGKLSYAIFDNLTTDFVLAHLIAGDAIEEDITEAGVRLSLKF